MPSSSTVPPIFILLFFSPELKCLLSLRVLLQSALSLSPPAELHVQHPEQLFFLGRAMAACPGSTPSASFPPGPQNVPEVKGQPRVCVGVCSEKSRPS